MKTIKFLFQAIILLSITFSSCKKEETNSDPCKNITCLNGGHCANAQCVCPQGYTGADCSQQITPSKIRVTKIEVTRFPAKDNGADWDDFLEGQSDPDIYPALFEANTVIWNSSNYITDASQTTYAFTPNQTIELNPTTQYSIQLYDHDAVTSDDFIEGIIFTPYSSTNGFPSTRILDAGGTVAFKAYLTYIF